jgi:hypothetical protein
MSIGRSQTDLVSAEACTTASGASGTGSRPCSPSASSPGASAVSDLPDHVDAFVATRVALHDERTRSNRLMAKEVRGPVEQMLSVVVPGFDAMGRPQRPQPFADTVPGFFDYLVDERPINSPIPTVE